MRERERERGRGGRKRGDGEGGVGVVKGERYAVRVDGESWGSRSWLRGPALGKLTTRGLLSREVSTKGAEVINLGSYNRGWRTSKGLPNKKLTIRGL